MSRQSKMIIIIGVVVWIFVLAGMMIYSSYIGDKSIERYEELEKQREQIESYIREHSEYLKSTDDVYIFSFEEGTKISVTHIIFDKNIYSFGNYCESVLNAVKECIDNNLLEWDYEKDELNILVKTNYETFVCNWCTNDLQKGFFADDIELKGYKTIEELKDCDLERIKRNYQ